MQVRKHKVIVLHFSVDLVAKLKAAKFLRLNSTCLEVQNVHTCVP